MTDEIREWAVFFVEMRSRILQEDGHDIAEDIKAMEKWFDSAYWMGKTDGNN